MQRTIVIMIIIFLVSVILGALFIIFFKGNNERKVEIVNKKTEEKIPFGETLLISKDHGETWERMKISGNYAVKEIVFSKNIEGRIYVVTLNNGILVKDKNNDNWSFLPLNKVTKNSSYYYLNEDIKGNIYISAYYDNKGKVIKLNLNDKTEEEIFETPLPKYAVFGINVLSDGKVLRLVSSDGGLYESVDYGYSWRVLSRFKEGLLNMTTNIKTGDFWILDSEGKVLKFSATTKKIENISNNLEDFKKSDTAQNIIFDEKSEYLYLTSGYGVLRIKPGANKWEEIPLIVPPEALPISAFAVNFYNMNEIYAGTKQQFYKSENNGKSWRTINLPTIHSVSKIMVDKIDPNIIYIGLE